MANIRAHGQLILQDQYLGIHRKGASVDGKVKNSKEAKKKGAGGLGNRKALIDITNSSCLRQEASSKKKKNLKEFNIAEEMCLHDHRKCMEERTVAMDRYRQDKFLLDFETVSPVASPKSKTSKAGVDSPPRSPELMPSPELPKSSWLNRDSPNLWESPPSPVRFELLIVDFVFKPDANN
ncbi:protein PATRONUS 2-like [Macadamia integrifolia]|uniref:protein PATRONUS 2-like n=1 Tax=Macadamia integrifolia TaxID=60698 RepID=UPI001C4E40E4|nr:protein PATRONUS 2-like [Macadamia integrifolia]XP_042505090.1 protein PATRONUS 2-like [Macadamia integrifolia]XP_042505091.1 protein PATRONUS 2-like [Macadamia integrifolia]